MTTEPAAEVVPAEPAAPEPDPEVVAAAATAAPAVARLSGGTFGEIATYLPGRRVSGVRVSSGRAEVHVVGRYGPSIAEIAGQVRSGILAALPFPVLVDVVVTDLDHPADHLDDAQPDEAPAVGPTAVNPTAVDTPADGGPSGGGS